MECTLTWALFLYLIIVAVILALAGLNAFHIIRFGSFDRRNRVMVSLYAIVVIAILTVTAFYFSTVDWSGPIQFSLPSISFPASP
ncbi:MAG: hypothetical protein V1778_00925 [bacterium]